MYVLNKNRNWGFNYDSIKLLIKMKNYLISIFLNFSSFISVSVEVNIFD